MADEIMTRLRDVLVGGTRQNVHLLVAATRDQWPCDTHLLIHPKEARRG